MAKNTENQIYVGIDLDVDAVMVSYSYGDGEPETVSPMAGSEIFAIPLAIAWKKDGGFVYGEEARRVGLAGTGRCEERLLERALRGEQVQFDMQMYAMSELLGFFLKKMVAMAGRLGPKAKLACLVLTVQTLDAPMIQLLQACIAAMELPRETVHLLDYKSSFFYYGSSQPPEFSTHDMGLFCCREKQMQFWCLQHGERTTPQLLTIHEERYGFEMQQADEVFERIIEQAIGKQIITAVYLVGDGFDGGWMKRSLQLLCKGRRVFLGKNLFSKGACFAALRFGNAPAAQQQAYVYMGEHEMKCNVSLKVYERGSLAFYTIVSAGVPWFEAQGSCEFIIDGTPSVDFWIQQPNSREARIESVELGGLPKRENRTTRIKIEALPKSDEEVTVVLTDVGLGELVPGTGKKWEHLLVF